MVTLFTLRIRLALHAGLNRIEYSGVTRTAAKVSVEPDLDFFQARARVTAQKRRCRHQHPGRAITALQCAVFEKLPLQLAQLALVAQAFHSRDLFTLASRRQNYAAVHSHSVQQDGAGAAMARLAAAFRAGEFQALPENIQQQRRFFRFDFDLFAINLEA